MQRIDVSHDNEMVPDPEGRYYRADEVDAEIERLRAVADRLRNALNDIYGIASEAEAWKDFSDGTVPIKDMLKIGAIAQKALSFIFKTELAAFVAEKENELCQT